MIHVFGSYEVDERRFELRRNGAVVPLQRRAFDLLVHLIRHAGAVCTREDLRVNVWGGAVVTKDAIAHAALSVRCALDDEAGIYVRTVRGRGYSFVGSVKPKSLAHEPLIGRAAALAAFYGRLASAARGRGSVLCFRGDIGAGKSRLLAELASHEGGLRTALVSATETSRARSLLLSRLATASSDPTVIALDDLDEGEAEIRDLFVTRTRELERVPLVLVSSTTRRLAAFAPEDTVEVEPFSRAEIAAYAERALQRPLGGAELESIHESGGGNALLTGLLVRGFGNEEIDTIVARLRARFGDRDLHALAESTSDGPVEMAKALGLVARREDGHYAFTQPAFEIALRAWARRAESNPPSFGGVLVSSPSGTRNGTWSNENRCGV